MASGLDALVLRPKKPKPIEPEALPGVEAPVPVDAELPPPDESAFESTLKTLGLLGYGVRNVLTGNIEGAGRNLVDLASSPFRALLPGDQSGWELSRARKGDDPGDYTEGSDLVGGMEPGLAKTAVDIGLGLVTDPLTYVGVGAVAGGAKGAAKVAQAVGAADKTRKALTIGVPFSKTARAVIPGSADALEAIGGAAGKAYGALPQGVREGAESAGRKVRAAFGAQRLGPEAQAIQQSARATGTVAAMASKGAISKALEGLDERQLNAIGDAVDNFRWQDGKLVGRLADDGRPLAERLAAHPDVTPDELPRLLQAAEEMVSVGRAQRDQPGVFRQLAKSGQETIAGVEPAAAGMSDEYLMRVWKGMPEEEGLAQIAGLPSPTKARSLKTFEDVQEFANSGAQYERNALVRAAGRAQAQGTLASRAEIGRRLVGDDFVYADPEMRAAALKSIEALAPEEAQVLGDMFKGLPPRGALTKVLSAGNSVFKKSAVYGFAIPRFAALVRNKTGGVFQTIANAESRPATMGQIKRFGSDIAGSISDSLGLSSKDQLGKTLSAWEDALRASGGSPDAAIAAMAKTDPNAAALFANGIADGFVRSEDLINEMARTGWRKKAAKIADWPGQIFKGVEDRMRLGLGLDLINSGKTPEEAARIVRDALYDYSQSSVANRTARDILPFFQFTAKAIPQSVKFLAEQPAAAVALRPLYTQDSAEDPIYPWMQRQTNIPLGKDEQGNPDYLTGLGLPVDVLNNVPNPSADPMNFLAQARQGIGGQLSPLIKTAAGALTGTDLTFGTPFASYDKAPEALQALGVPERGGVGRAYNALAGTGVIQPLASPVQYLSGLLDERRSAGEKAIGALTGARIESVDEDRALQQILADFLRKNQDIGSFQSLYSKSDDPRVQALIRAMNEARKRSREKSALASD